MSDAAVKRVRRATRADLDAVPLNKVAELVGGVLHVQPRPTPRCLYASSVLGRRIGGPLDHEHEGPGGWWILREPELRFPDPAPEEPGDIEALVPNMASWRRERMPELPDTAYIELVPDWICEILSDSTEDLDRNEKMPIYAREGVRHACLIDPDAKTLEEYVLGAQRRWNKPRIHRGAAIVRLAPFDAIDLRLSALWPEPAGRPRGGA
jgi:catechol 2,3-dioxygenase-like lactoylglutathione lyase family enzyme